MGLEFVKAGTSDALTLNCISKQSFDSDMEVGAPSAGGPPGYMSLKFHMKMARSGNLHKLTDNGLIIGKTGNPFTFRVVNDRLAFYMNDTEVAYLSNNKLYVTQAEILTKLIIGKFAFVPQTNGNMSIVYNG